VASARGGVTIEDIAEKDPSAIIKDPIDIKTGLKPGQVRRERTERGGEAVERRVGMERERAVWAGAVSGIPWVVRRKREEGWRGQHETECDGRGARQEG